MYAARCVHVVYRFAALRMAVWRFYVEQHTADALPVGSAGALC